MLGPFDVPVCFPAKGLQKLASNEGFCVPLVIDNIDIEALNEESPVILSQCLCSDGNFCAPTGAVTRHCIVSAVDSAREPTTTSNERTRRVYRP